MAHVPSEHEAHKRTKMGAGDSPGGASSAGAASGSSSVRHGGHQQTSSPPSHPSPNASTPINYFTRANYDKLRLIEPDGGGSFPQLLGLLADYEGVLARRESLAANLGASLATPRFIKAVERDFETRIRTSPTGHNATHSSPNTPTGTSRPLCWPDIIHYARSNPEWFTTGSRPGSGERVCRFVVGGGVQVEVTEEDWRFVRGALEGVISEGQVGGDEEAEAASIDIVEERLGRLVAGAEEVARRARGLAHALGERRRRMEDSRREGYGPGGRGGATGFQPVNANERKRKAGSSGRAGEWGDLHTELLRQFNAPGMSPPLNLFAQPNYLPRPSTVPAPPAHPPHPPAPSPHTPTSMPPHAFNPGPQSLPYPVPRYPLLAPSGTLPPPPPPMTPRKDSGAEEADSIHRPFITSMVEKLGKGDEILPPCDRCRRLEKGCLKNLTACQGCTRKHARCTWKGATEEEIAGLRRRVDMRRRPGQTDLEAAPGRAGVVLDRGHGHGGSNERVLAAHLMRYDAARDAAGDHGRARLDLDNGLESRRDQAGERQRRRASTGGEGVAMSRMDIDSITTQMPSPPRRQTSTGLPRDPNFLISLPPAAADSKESPPAGSGSAQARPQG